MTLYAVGGAAVAPIGSAFPGSVVNGSVDRVRLAALLGSDPAAFVRLEAIVHPLVAIGRQAQLEAARLAGVRLAVLDIPLLFETGGDENVDAVVVVTADAEIQRRRVLARPGLTEDRFETLLSRQMPDAEKRRRGNFLIDTGQGIEAARAEVRKIVGTVLAADWIAPRQRLSQGREPLH